MGLVRLFYAKPFGSAGFADATCNFFECIQIEFWPTYVIAGDDAEFGELSQIECCTGIVASSLPACRPLLRHLKNKLITKGNKVNQRVILSISRKQTEDYHMSDDNASRGNNTSTKSDLDDERLYIPLE